jgi:transposase
VALPAAQPQAAPPADIRLEVRPGALAVNVMWPVSAAADCAAWLRELLR